MISQKIFDKSHQNGGDGTSRNGLKLYIKHATGLVADCDIELIKTPKML